MKKSKLKKYRFLLYPKPTWTEILRAKDDPEYEIDDLF